MFKKILSLILIGVSLNLSALDELKKDQNRLSDVWKVRLRAAAGSGLSGLALFKIATSMAHMLNNIESDVSTLRTNSQNLLKMRGTLSFLNNQKGQFFANNLENDRIISKIQNQYNANLKNIKQEFLHKSPKIIGRSIGLVGLCGLAFASMIGTVGFALTALTYQPDQK